MTDIVERLRATRPQDDPHNLMDMAADEIERLKEWGKEYVVRVAELERENSGLLKNLQLAVWTDSEQCKFLELENQRLRIALDEYACHKHNCARVRDPTDRCNCGMEEVIVAAGLKRRP